MTCNPLRVQQNQNTETMPLALAAAVWTNRITSLRELLHYCITIVVQHALSKPVCYKVTSKFQFLTVIEFREKTPVVDLYTGTLSKPV